MLTRKETRAQACATLKGKWTQPVLATLIYFAIMVVYEILANSDALLMSLVMCLVISLAVILNLGYGFVVSLLRFSRGNEKNRKRNVQCRIQAIRQSMGLAVPHRTLHPFMGTFANHPRNC